MMSIPLLFLLVITVAFLFFGLIPGIGAFSVRSHWRNFRRRMLEVSLFPFVQYSDVTRADKSPGNFRLFGRLEAIQADNRIWVNSGSFTMEVDLTGVQLYTLPSYSIAEASRSLGVEYSVLRSWKKPCRTANRRVSPGIVLLHCRLEFKFLSPAVCIPVKATEYSGLSPKYR